MEFGVRVFTFFLGIVLSSLPAFAEGKVDARYSITIGGFPIGKADLVADFKKNTYEAAGNARLTGLINVFTSGQGSVGSRGVFKDVRLEPLAYTAQSTSDKKQESIRYAMSGGAVKDLVTAPETPPAAECVMWLTL
jgi:hypothetical protein